MDATRPLAQSRTTIPYNSNVAFPDANDLEYAKIVARRLFEMYDQNKNNIIEEFEVNPIMKEVYKSINPGFNPSNNDIKEYSKVMDCDKDGTVTYADVEALCIKYLTGRYQPSVTMNNYANYSTPLRGSQELNKRAATPTYLRRSGDVSTDDNRYTTPNKRYVSPGTSSGSSPYIPGENTNYLGSYKRPDFSASPYDRPESLKRTAGVGNYNLAPYNDSEVYKKDSLLNRGDVLKSSVVVGKSKVGQIRRVFDKYDTNKDGHIDQEELKGLMAATFGYLGLKRSVTSIDIKSFMDLVDSDKDGLVSFEEYESTVLRGLSKYNIKLEN